MGKTIVHAGGAGNGQAAKICNNMILGISMIAVSEAFVLAEKLGLDHAEAVRHLVEVVRPVLVDDELLSGAGTGADLARQPRLSGGLHRRDDAEGSEARAGSGARGRGARRRWAPRRQRFTRAMSEQGESAARIFPASSASCAAMNFTSHDRRSAREMRNAACLSRDDAEWCNERVSVRIAELSFKTIVHRGK